MKRKGLLIVYIIAAVLSVHLILVAGCGKNPLLGSLGSSLDVGVGDLNFLTSMKGSTQWLAHNSATPDTFIITVLEIGLDKEDGSHVTIWQGSQEVDLSKITSLADVPTFKGDIPTGKYKKFKLYCGANWPKIKGTVTIGGTTYYTKANHTNYTTPPAELEEIRPWGMGGAFALQQEFYPAMQLDGSVSKVYVLLDLSYYLLYYDGDKDSSEGYDPMGSQNYINAGGKPAMFLGELPFAFVIGNPGKKEVYEYTTTWSSSPGTARLTLIFDGADNLIGANARTLLVNSKGVFFKLYGSLSNEYGTAGISPNAFKKNADGTYRVEMSTIGPGSPTGAQSTVFSNFQRATHTGSFTQTSYKSGTDLTVTGTTTGTYTVTRVQ